MVILEPLEATQSIGIVPLVQLRKQTLQIYLLQPITYILLKIILILTEYIVIGMVFPFAV